jgi:glucose-1-phosphate thymidylyltransferase
LLGRGIAWLDTGTHDSLMKAGNFVEIIEKRQGLKIACLEEIAFRMGFIDINKVKDLGNKQSNNHYGRYLLELVNSLSGNV